MSSTSTAGEPHIMNTFIDLFENQVGLTPNNIAVIFADRQLTYKELNSRANQLANYLKLKGISNDMLVPICIEHSPEMLIGILGILKAGGAYVPINTEYPVNIEFLLGEINASLVLCSSTSKKLWFPFDLELVDISGEWEMISDQSVENIESVIEPNQLAYLIYSSESSGLPKGTMIEHGNLYHYLINIKAPYTEGFAVTSGTFSHVPYTFGASITSLFLPLITGYSIVISSYRSADIFQDPEFKKYAPYQFIKLTPIQLILLENVISESELIANVIIVGGEAVKTRHIKFLLQKNTAFTIINEYGITAATVGSSFFKIDKQHINDHSDEIPIGKPFGNTSFYILDENLFLCPIGTVGELFIGGPGISRGYLNRENLTADKFIKNPFENIDGKLYRTGDLVKSLPDGNIQYIGRVADQVTIGDYCVEPGKLESILNKLPEISLSAVVAKKNAMDLNKLVGYYVLNFGILKDRERDLYQQRIEDWAKLYSTEYNKQENSELEELEEEFNIVGWNDTFTGHAIPSEQMREWLDDIVDVIRSDYVGRVLEIGCGTGLIYYSLVGHADKYIGTDISSSSISQIKRRISKGKRDYGIPELHVCPAHEIRLSDKEEIDTIIINSVIQYFPGEDYLKTVIANSLEILGDKGRIIIGDVRDNRLQKLFKGRLYLNKLKGEVTIQDFKWGLDQELLNEVELCVSPKFFYDLERLYPQISHVNIRWKRGKSINELNSYRYTVIIYVGLPKEKLYPNWISWEQIKGKQNLTSIFNNSDQLIGIRDMPNPRLQKERLLEEVLNNTGLKTVHDILEFINKDNAEENVLNDLISNLDSQFQIALYPTNNILNFDVLISKSNLGSYTQHNFDQNLSSDTFELVNVPLFNEISPIINREINQKIKALLPEYLFPAPIFPVARLPLTAHGKIDKKYLIQQIESRNRYLNS